MKKLVRYFNVLIIILLFLHTACEEGGTLTGSTNVTVLSSVSFTNTQVVANSSGLVASGIATNNSSVATGSPWYIECDFYNIDVFANKFLIGGGNQQINQPLNSLFLITGRYLYLMIILVITMPNSRRSKSI